MSELPSPYKVAVVKSSVVVIVQIIILIIIVNDLMLPGMKPLTIRDWSVLVSTTVFDPLLIRLVLEVVNSAGTLRANHNILHTYVSPYEKIFIFFHGQGQAEVDKVDHQQSKCPYLCHSLLSYCSSFLNFMLNFEVVACVQARCN